VQRKGRRHAMNLGCGLNFAVSLYIVSAVPLFFTHVYLPKGHESASRKVDFKWVRKRREGGGGGGSFGFVFS
jgi:hypothetical protein